MKESLYRYCWGNNERRASMRGRICRLLSRLTRNSAAIEFVDDPGVVECVSRNALRRIKP